MTARKLSIVDMLELEILSKAKLQKKIGAEIVFAIEL